MCPSRRKVCGGGVPRRRKNRRTKRGTYRDVNQTAIKISERFALNGRLHLSVLGTLTSFPENASVSPKLCRFFGIRGYEVYAYPLSLPFDVVHHRIPSSFSAFFPACLSLPSSLHTSRASFAPYFSPKRSKAKRETFVRCKLLFAMAVRRLRTSSWNSHSGRVGVSVARHEIVISGNRFLLVRGLIRLRIDASSFCDIVGNVATIITAALLSPNGKPRVNRFGSQDPEFPNHIGSPQCGRLSVGLTGGVIRLNRLIHGLM